MNKATNQFLHQNDRLARQERKLFKLAKDFR